MDPLMPLLQLCDSLFPLGSFAHSDGLESAVQGGGISNGDDLAAWMAVCLGVDRPLRWPRHRVGLVVVSRRALVSAPQPRRRSDRHAAGSSCEDRHARDGAAARAHLAHHP